MSAHGSAKFNARRRLVVTASGLALSTLLGGAAAPLAQTPQAAPSASARTWVGHEPAIEAHLKTAAVASLEYIGTGVTRPRRAHLTPPEPVESAAWKVLRPGRRNGYWESYKSEIAAYELDKLLDMRMVPPAVERRIDGEIGAAIMWLPGVRSVKEIGGKMPSGLVWGKAIRKMRTFDNLIGNADRNAGNILVGAPGELILIDHSRAFVGDAKLPTPVERVDAELWERITALGREDLTRALGQWIDDWAIDAMLERRGRMIAAVDALVKEKGRALVVVR